MTEVVSVLHVWQGTGTPSPGPLESPAHWGIPPPSAYPSPGKPPRMQHPNPSTSWQPPLFLHHWHSTVAATGPWEPWYLYPSWAILPLFPQIAGCFSAQLNSSSQEGFSGHWPSSSSPHPYPLPHRALSSSITVLLFFPVLTTIWYLLYCSQPSIQMATHYSQVCLSCVLLDLSPQNITWNINRWLINTDLRRTNIDSSSSFVLISQCQVPNSKEKRQHPKC